MEPRFQLWNACRQSACFYPKGYLLLRHIFEIQLGTSSARSCLTIFSGENSMSNMNPDEKQKQDQWKKTGNDPMKDQKREQKDQQQQKPNNQPWQQGQKPQQPKPQPGQHHTDDEKNPDKRTA